MYILQDVKAQLPNYVLQRVENSIRKNPDLYFYGNLPVDEKILMKFSPLVSVDVERSFSIYRAILTDRRRGTKETKLAMMNVIQVNNFIDISDIESDDD